MLLGLLVGFVYIVIERRLVKYTLKRLLGSALTLFIIVAVVFILLRQMPIEGYFDNFDKLNETQVNVKLKQLGLTQPIYKQFWDFLVKLFHGDLGSSTRYSAGTPITSIIAKKAPISIYIGLMSMALSLVLGIPLGAAMARSKSGFWDRFGTVFIVLINAVPAAVYYIFIQMYGTSWMGISMLLAVVYGLNAWREHHEEIAHARAVRGARVQFLRARHCRGRKGGVPLAVFRRDHQPQLSDHLYHQ